MVISSDKTLSPFSTPVEARSNLRQALPQILAVCVKNVLLLGFGMTLGFPTILIPSLSGNNPEETFHLGQEAISWIGSINLICVPVGCLLSGVITQPIGRKRAMQLVNIPFLAAWLLFHFSTDVWQVFLALALTGFTGGLLEAPILTYVAEITQPSLRGILSTSSGVAVIAGILVQFSFGTFLSWRKIALINCVTHVASFTLLFLVPESPHWLVMKNRLQEAQTNLAWFRGWVSLDEVKVEFDELCRQLDESKKEVKISLMGNFKLYKEKKFWWPFSLIGFAFFLSHFTGTLPVQVYAVKIFATLHSPIDKYYATVMLGVAELLGCILTTCIVHYLGKRMLSFLSLISCGICFLIVASFAYSLDILNLNLNEDLYDPSPEGWIPMSCLIGAFFFTHIGIKHLPWLLIGEVYHTEIRTMASGLSAAFSYILSFVASKVFLSMIALLTFPGTFWLYSGVCFVGTVVLYFILPETEGKTLYDITQHFADNLKLDNKVLRHKNTFAGNSAVNKGFVEDESKL